METVREFQISALENGLNWDPLEVPYVQTELEQTQDRLRAAEVVIMAQQHRIERLESLMKQVYPFETFEQRELKYDPEGLRLVVKDSKEWQ